MESNARENVEVLMNAERRKPVRYGMVIDIDRCTGCGACTIACSVENNVSVPPPQAGDRRGLTWIRVYRLDNGRPYPHNRTAFVPLACQHCEHNTS